MENLMNRKFLSRRKNKLGMTITELAIVLGSISIVLGGIWAIGDTVWEGFRYRKTNDFMMTVVQNVRAYYDGMGRIYDDPVARSVFGDGDDITDVLDADNRRLIPIEMRFDPAASGSGIHHPLSTRNVGGGGSFHVESQANGLQFRVVLYGLTQSACMKMLMEFPVLIPEVGVTRIGTQSNSTAVNHNNPANPGANLPINITTAENWCNDASNPINNEVAIDFELKN